MTQRFFSLIIFLFLIPSAYAQAAHGGQARAATAQSQFHREAMKGHLTAREIERVKALKQLLCDVDGTSLRQTVDELEKTDYPRLNLQIREAMAKAYGDIVRDKNVEGQKKKEWLYSMVALNMAYLQFAGGAQGSSGSAEPLNRLIRRKLKEYLPPDAINQPGFRYVLD